MIAASCSLAGLYICSQLPLYFVGGSLSYIDKDIGGTEIEAWLPVANTLTIAAVAPFCGYLEDIFGRRNITLSGCLLLIIGQIVLGTAYKIGPAIAAMSIAGAGAAIGELSALAGIAEVVPVAKRGIFHGLLTMSIMPFTPYVIYSQLLSAYATWRCTIWISLIVTGLSTAGLVAAYFPEHHAQHNPREILRSLDYIGGFCVIVGVTLFLVAMQAGGYTHPWTSSYVLVQLILGFILIVIFIVWEWKFAKNPIVPPRLFSGQKIVATAFLVSFVAGMNFYSLLNFYPLTFSEVYSPDPVSVGLKGLGYGISTTLGASFINATMSVLRGHNRSLFVLSAVMMTAFGGALAATTPDTPGEAVAFGTLAAFGIGGLLVPPITVAIYVVPDDLIATATALSLSFRVVGGSIGYTIYYAIFANKLKTYLPEYVADAALKAGLPKSSVEPLVGAVLTQSPAVTKVPGVTPSIIAAATYGARAGFTKSLSYVWIASVPFGVFAVIAYFFLKDVRSYMTGRVATHIKFRGR